MLPQTLPSAPVSHSLRNRNCTVFDIALGTYPQDTVYVTTDITMCTSFAFIGKQKMYRLWHSTWYILPPPPGHCLYYHRHHHLHQFTSVEDLLATTIASDQLYWVTTTFSNFLKRASTVLLLQWTFYQIRKAVISRRYNQKYCRYFCPFFHRHSSILIPQLRNRQVIFVTSFSFERRIELTHVIFRLQRVDRN